MPPYRVGSLDRLNELSTFPAMDPGAPEPLIVATELEVRIAYLGCDTGHQAFEDSEPVVLARFRSARAHYRGPPNDEALAGHPLYARGLKHYAAFEVLESSWIRELEVMNRGHVHHNPGNFVTLRHFIIAFHDTTFECVAEGYEAQRAYVRSGGRLLALQHAFESLR